MKLLFVEQEHHISASPALSCAVVPACNNTGKMFFSMACKHRHYRHYMLLCRHQFVPAMIYLYANNVDIGITGT